MDYEPTIGLEIHIEPKTQTKMFCGCLNDPDEKQPNKNICPICMAHPGTLPVPNETAIAHIVSLGLALNCEINEYSKFDRKNYFYPDLPKGYQISQAELPICHDGGLKVGDHIIRIERIHMEEDAGKLQHGNNNETLVDYNRAGVPLMELVTKPDITSSAQISGFAKELQLIARYIGVSDADMEKGQMRVEVNISIKPVGSETLGTKVEVKNINSISAAVKAADYEFKRQVECMETGEKIVQETRGWDDVKQITVSQRVKEGSADYRYFPEPDIPPLHCPSSSVEELRGMLPELPQQRRTRFKMEYGLTDAQIEVFTITKSLGDFFEEVASEVDAWDNLKHDEPTEEDAHAKLYTLAANYIVTEFPALIDYSKITAENFAELIVKLYHKELSSSAAKTVLDEMSVTGEDPDVIMKSKDLGQVSNVAELDSVVDDVLAANPKPVEDYKKGKKDSIKFIVGKVMAATKGKANPEVVFEILERKLQG